MLKIWDPQKNHLEMTMNCGWKPVALRDLDFENITKKGKSGGRVGVV